MTLRITNASVLSGVLLFALNARSASAQPYTINGGEVNISGATLMRPFFVVPASTNDHIDVDGDGCPPGSIPPCPLVDQLAPTFIPGSALNTWWLVQYRGVGSVNGFEEFVKYQTCGTIPTSIPGELGLFNRFQYAATGTITWAGPYADASGTPRSPSSIDLAILDVESSWAVKNGNPINAAWNIAPNNSGYGQNPILSNTGWNSALDDLGRDCVGGDGIDDTFLNTNTGSPDANTIFDTRIAWAPIVYTANRGTGVAHLKMTELHHLFVAGRLPSGENLVACTRSSGSGTRNGIMNTSGIDTTWGRGDNLANESNSSARFLLGPQYQPTNAEGSSLVESAIQNTRLAVGYTGLAGASRAADDALAGRYEVIDVMFDDRGGASYVRPTIDTVLDNANANTGYQLGGTATLVSRGDPLETNNLDPTYMANQDAADYVRNILDSVVDFVAAPGDPANFGSPGEYLATTFFGVAGMDALPNPSNPDVFVANAGLNQPLQDFIRANNGLGIGGDTPVYGSANQAGLSPTRTVSPVLADTGGKYSDGKGPGNSGYCYSTSNAGNGSPATLAGGVRLGQRNRISGDFNNDGLRNLNDADKLVTAMFAPRQFEMGVVHAGDAGVQSVNTVIPEVIGDFDGDGDFIQQDLRYFADGLAIDPGTGKLNRKQGAIAIDNAILAHGPATDYLGNPVADTHDWLPWRSTARTIVVPPSTACDPPKYAVPSPSVNDVGSPFLKTGKTYAPGDFRGDVAGGTPAPGAKPVGFDGRVDAKDIDYVCKNFGTWSNINHAVLIDLSADMDGDLDVDAVDVDELVLNILDTNYGDVDLDGDVDAADEAIINANLGQPGGWAQGNLNCDGIVDATDHAIWAANVTPSCSAPVITDAESTKTHTGVGDFGINVGVPTLPQADESECRNAGPTRIDVTFSTNIVAADGTFNGGTGAGAPPPGQEVRIDSGVFTGATVVGGNVLRIVMSGATDPGCLHITLSGIACDAGGGSPGATMPNVILFQKVVLGDTNNNGICNATDIAQTKNRNTATPVDTTTFRSDTNLNGTVNASDIAQVKSRNLGSLAPTCP